MRLSYLLAVSVFFVACSSSQKAGTTAGAATSGKWRLIFQDEFNASGSFDTTKWSFCKRGNPAWAKYLTQSGDYASLNGSNLLLRMDKKNIEGDNVPYHSGGIQTKGKFSFLYGKVEVRAKFSGGKGSWPAIWMMPERDTYGGWPASGEIDIMEHVNNESVMHQTIHNSAVTNSSGGSSATKSSPYKAGDYNVYGIVWTPDKIDFYVNDSLAYTYAKPANATAKEWPFDQPFYIILNQSGGAGWPGPIRDADLPFSMVVDWLRVYRQ